MIKTNALFAALTSMVFFVSPAEAVFDEAAVRTLLENGQFEQAKTALEPEVKADRRNHKALYYLGYSYLFLNEPEPAIKNIRKAIECLRQPRGRLPRCRQAGPGSRRL